MNEGGAETRRWEKALNSRPGPDALKTNDLLFLLSEKDSLIDGKRTLYRAVCCDYRDADMIWVGFARLTPQDVDKFMRDYADAEYGLDHPQVQQDILDMGLKRVPMSETEKLLDS